MEIVNPRLLLTAAVAAILPACVSSVSLGKDAQPCPCATGFQCELATQKCVAQARRDAGDTAVTDAGPAQPSDDCDITYDAAPDQKQPPDAGPPTCNQISASPFGPAIVGAPLELLYAQPAEDAMPEALKRSYFGSKVSRRTAAAVLASDDSNVYLCHGPVVRLGKADHSVFKIADGAGCGFSITIAGGRVVFVGDAQVVGGQRVAVVPATGGDQKTIAKGSAITCVATDGQAVWWADHSVLVQDDYNQQVGGFEIWTTDMTGASVRKLFQGSAQLYRIIPSASQFFASGFCDSTYTYGPTVFDLASASQELFSKEKLYSGDGSKLDMADDATQLWVVIDGVVTSVPKDGSDSSHSGTARSRVADPTSNEEGRERLLTRGLVVNEGGVWIASNAEGTNDYSIRSLPSGASTYNLLATCSRPISDLVVDARAIYAVTTNPTMVWKLSRGSDAPLE